MGRKTGRASCSHQDGGVLRASPFKMHGHRDSALPFPHFNPRIQYLGAGNGAGHPPVAKAELPSAPSAPSAGTPQLPAPEPELCRRGRTLPCPYRKGLLVFSQLTPGLGRIPGAPRRRKRGTGTPRLLHLGWGRPRSRGAHGGHRSLPGISCCSRALRSSGGNGSSPGRCSGEVAAGRAAESCKALQKFLRDHLEEEQPEPGVVPMVSLGPLSRDVSHAPVRKAPWRWGWRGCGSWDGTGDRHRGRGVPAEPGVCSHPEWWQRGRYLGKLLALETATISQ